MADRLPLPLRSCIVTNLEAGRPLHFSLSVACGVALMEKPIGSALDLFTVDQMHAHAAAVSAAKDAQIAALRAEVAGLRQDAERYRWLRDGDLNADYPYPVMRVGGDGHDYAVWFEELDAAIDAALAARKGEA